jgi:hypothetical protein
MSLVGSADISLAPIVLHEIVCRHLLWFFLHCISQSRRRSKLSLEFEGVMIREVVYSAAGEPGLLSLMIVIGREVRPNRVAPKH